MLKIEGLLYGCKVCRGAPRNSHLLFVNDSFFFFEATIEECAVMKDILTHYECASGQSDNLHKSGIAFSTNVDVFASE